MTLDTTSDSTTTAAAATGGEAASESAPTAPARAKRTTRTRATRATKAAPSAADDAAEPAAAGDAATSEGAGPAAEEAPAKPARKRATRTSKAAATSESGTDAADTQDVGTTAAVRATTTARTSRARSATRSATAEAPAATIPEAAAPSFAAAAPAEEQAPAAPKRRRATRATAAAVADVPAQAPAPAATPEPTPTPTTEPAPAAEAVAVPAAGSAPAAPARRSRRVTRPAGHTTVVEKAPVAPAAVEPVVAAPVEELADEEIAEAIEQAEATSAAVPEGRLDVFAELGRQAPAPAPVQAPAVQAPAVQAPAPAQAPAAQAPVRRAPAVRTPAQPPAGERPASARLATTALLFQAPEATPRRRRRAQASSGSPEVISAAAQAAEAELAAEQEAAAQAVAAESVEETPAPSRRRGRGRGRATRAEAPTSQATVSTEVEVGETEAHIVEAVEETEFDVIDADATDERTDEDAVDGEESSPRRRRRRGGRGRRSRGTGDGDAETADESEAEPADAVEEPVEDAGDRTEDEADEHDEQGSSSRRRRRRRRSGRGGDSEPAESAPRSRSGSRGSDEVTALRGSTRLEAKRQRRREGRDAGRRRQIITEAEFLARRESVERSMVVRESNGRTQIAVLEDGVLVEHYVSRQAQVSMAGNVYLGRVQNVLPSMEAAFIDVGKGRNAVLYAGEVNWDAAGLEGGQPRRIEQALKSGDPVLAQVTKDPIGHKGARLTSQITLAGRYLVYVPGGGMTGISRKLPEPERARLKKILREVVPDSAGVIVRTAAEGASEEELRADIARLQSQWEAIEKKSKSASAPALLQGEPDLAIRVVRDIFNDDFSSLVVEGDEAWSTISGYIGELAPDLAQKVSRWTGQGDVFAAHRVDEQLAKGMDRKVWLPSGGSLVIDRTEAMTVVDVNTGKFTGAGGTLEETVTRNNLEAAEEIVRQLRLRDIGGIIVIDFIDMVLESNRDLVLRRLVECLGRDRTKHQVAEVTSLGLVQMTRKRVGQGLVEAFSETCEHCNGRGFIVHTDPVEKTNGRPDAGTAQPPAPEGEPKRSRRKRGTKEQSSPAVAPAAAVPVLPEARETVKATLATIAAAAAHAHLHDDEVHAEAALAVDSVQETVADVQPAPVVEVPEVEAEPVPHPVLDVFAALGDLAARVPEVAPAADEPTGSVELTPVDPGLFELPDADGEQSEDDAS